MESNFHSTIHNNTLSDFNLVDLSVDKQAYQASMEITHTNKMYQDKQSQNHAPTSTTPLPEGRSSEEIEEERLPQYNPRDFIDYHLQHHKRLQTRTKNFNNATFTDLISDLTALYWTTLQPANNIIDIQNQDAVTYRLLRLRDEIREIKRNNGFDATKLVQFAETFTELSEHMNPFILQTFISAQTSKSVQELKSLKRRSYLEGKRQKTQNGEQSDPN